MTNIEQKALELVDEVRLERKGEVASIYDAKEALCRAIEQHEAFRQEVSDVIEQLIKHREAEWLAARLNRFIITKPDPLVEAMRYITTCDDAKAAEQLRAELAKRGLEIREKTND